MSANNCDGVFTGYEPHDGQKPMHKSINVFQGLVPKVHEAIKIAEEKGLCQKEDLDLRKCRESLLLPVKVLLFNKMYGRLDDSHLVAFVVAIFKQECDGFNF